MEKEGTLVGARGYKWSVDVRSRCEMQTKEEKQTYISLKCKDVLLVLVLE